MDNLTRMQIRAMYANNDRQHNRMVKDKLRSLHRALLYSYQSAWIKKDGTEEENYVRALINPDKVKFDYDEKIVSVDFEHGFKPGDTFEWRGTDTHWIILKQELTEVAYFRANVRRCQSLEVINEETGETDTVWMAIRGPIETKINTIQKAGIVADVPNMSLVFYVGYSERNRQLFERYKRFEFDGRFWQVQAPDTISTPGIIEVTAEEDFECHGDELLIALVDPNPEVNTKLDHISGDTFVKPLTTVVYKAETLNMTDTWSVRLPNENKDIKDVLTWEANGRELKIKWTAMVSGSFIIQYGSLEKTIVVESLF